MWDTQQHTHIHAEIIFKKKKSETALLCFPTHRPTQTTLSPLSLCLSVTLPRYILIAGIMCSVLHVYVFVLFLVVCYI